MRKATNILSPYVLQAFHKCSFDNISTANMGRMKILGTSHIHGRGHFGVGVRVTN